MVEEEMPVNLLPLESEADGNRGVAMSRAAPAEIDFLGLEKHCATAVFRPPASTFRGIQDAVSKLDPQLLRTVLASGAAAATAERFIPSPVTWPLLAHVHPPPSPPFSTLRQPTTPVVNPASRFRPLRSAVESPRGPGAPLTIFYNGIVAVFDLPHHKAEAVLRWAEATHAEDRREEGLAGALAGNGTGGDQQQLPSILDKVGGDIPIARRKSLQRFLEKRKERCAPVKFAISSSGLTEVFPRTGSTASSTEWAGDSELSSAGKEKRQRYSME